MADQQEDTPQIAAVKHYFRQSDVGAPDMLDGFTEDFELYFPKFGIGRGKAAFMEFAGGLIGTLNSIAHDLETMRFIESGNIVVVEGRTSGEDKAGARWKGGETPGGRFCSIYEFENGLIARMHIHLDPDYTGRDEARFLWGKDRSW